MRATTPSMVAVIEVPDFALSTLSNSISEFVEVLILLILFEALFLYIHAAKIPHATLINILMILKTLEILSNVTILIPNVMPKGARYITIMLGRLKMRLVIAEIIAAPHIRR